MNPTPRPVLAENIIPPFTGLDGQFCFLISVYDTGADMQGCNYRGGCPPLLILVMFGSIHYNFISNLKKQKKNSYRYLTPFNCAPSKMHRCSPCKGHENRSKTNFSNIRHHPSQKLQLETINVRYRIVYKISNSASLRIINFFYMTITIPMIGNTF